MKYSNLVLTVMLSFFIIGSYAQESQETQEPIKNKNGVDILPVKGDYAVGFNAVPFLNLISTPGTGNDKFIENLFGQNSIFGKKMIDDQTAIRAKFDFYINSFNNDNLVEDNTANSPDILVADEISVNDQSYALSAGIEKRRGKGRVQGIYGGELAVLFSRSTRSYNYGNAFGPLNQTPTSTNWSNNGFPDGSSPQGERITEDIHGNTFGVGVRPFVGIEYFFAPQISIGAEFGWILLFSTTGEGEQISEFYSVADDEVYTKNIPLAGSNSFTANIDNLDGAVVLLFYF